ncbi:MAG TPA: glycosyltransferase family 2 protein [Candidatus Saccharimonadales bacterium]|nr:glycosyltransferase family 2 protein [Candidatus Saccharimonadales bacterium]
MKLVVQIPCLNEQDTLPLVINSIPKKIVGIDKIEILVIDDGSTDKTIAVAKKLGVKHFVHHTRNMGLAKSFSDGVMKALEMGADIVVNTDGDNQYPQADIPKLVKPIIDGRADIVVANRQVNQIREFSWAKKGLQLLGSKVVNLAAGTDIPDAASGFRAYSRESVIALNIITRFSYCMETIIQAGNKRLAITSIPIKTNAKTRPSRLFKSTPEHVFKSTVAILRSLTMYKPYLLFITLGTLFLALGSVPFLRYLWFYFHHDSDGHIQSLVIGGLLLTCSLLSYVLGVIADLVRINRILIEDQLTVSKREHLKSFRANN